MAKELIKSRILIVGAGRGGNALVELFSNLETVQVVGVVDRDQGAPGMQRARELNIPTSEAWRDFLKKLRVDEIVNVTGSEDVQKELIDTVEEGVEVIGGHSARLLWDIIGGYNGIKKDIANKEELLRSIVMAAPIAIFALNRKGEFLLSEGQGLDTLGLMPQDVMGQFIFDVYRTKPEVLTCIKRALDGEKTFLTAEIRDKVFQLQFSPIISKGGTIKGMVGVATDITAIKEMEKELKHRLHDLETFHKATVDREMKMLELKKRISELEKELKRKSSPET